MASLQTKSVKKFRELMKTSWRVQARDFFDNTTLHGVRYIAEENRPFHEKFIWFCSTAMGLTAALIIIVSLWEKFQTNPTITGLDTDFHNWDVPFPALTLCQNDPTNVTLVDEYIAKTWPSADEEKRAYYHDFLVAISNITFENLANLRPYLQDSTLPQSGFKQIAYQIVNRCDVLTDCGWKGAEEDDCCPYFYPIYTENGFCYTFNLRFNETEWPYEENKRVSFKQEYIQETDVKWAMSVSTDDASNNSVAVFITSSNDLPDLDTAAQHVWNRRITRVAFSPKETYTTADARQLSIKQRRCVYDDELQLLTDFKYTYTACRKQCRMELALRLCKCVPHFYASFVKDNDLNFKYCDLKGLGCLIPHVGKFYPDQLECPCELGCMNTVYEVEKLHDASNDMDFIPLEMGFVSWPMVRYKREVLFGWVDLLVAFGGIAGLFLGFSLLSGVEIIYYFTLRAWCMVYRDKEQLERLHEEYSKMEKPEVDLSLRPAGWREGSPNTEANRNLNYPGREDMVGGLGLAGGRIHPLGGNQRRRVSISNYPSLQHPQAGAWNIPYLP